MNTYNVEIAEILKDNNILELSEKMEARNLTSEETQSIEVIDTFIREIGVSGHSLENDKLISELIVKQVEPLLFNPDSSILSQIFDMGTIGEFDENLFTGVPKNTIKVYDAVRGGNVPKSFVDPTLFTIQQVKLQAETEINYSDLRRNGFKSIAKLTELTREALEQEFFWRLFAGVGTQMDALSGDQNIDATSSLTLALADTFSRYMSDMSEGNPIAVGLSKYTDLFKRLDGYEPYISDSMKTELNRLGKLMTYDGTTLVSVPTAKKTATGKNLMPDKRIFGIAGKIGECTMRGALRSYETYDNNAEKITLKFTGYDFDYVVYYLDKIAQIRFA